MQPTKLKFTLLLTSLLTVACATPSFAQQPSRDAKADLNITPGLYKLVSFSESSAPARTASPYCDSMEVTWDGTASTPILLMGPRLMFGGFNQNIPSETADPLDPEACRISYTAATGPQKMAYLERQDCKTGTKTIQTNLEVQSNSTLHYSIVTKSTTSGNPTSNRIECVLKLQP
jgi:hypothetical protein